MDFKWPTRDKECRAVLDAISHWSTWVKGRYFTIGSDHHSLQHLRSQRNLRSRQERLLDILADFNFDVVCGKGLLWYHEIIGNAPRLGVPTLDFKRYSCEKHTTLKLQITRVWQLHCDFCKLLTFGREWPSTLPSSFKNVSCVSVHVKDLPFLLVYFSH